MNILEKGAVNIYMVWKVIGIALAIILIGFIKNVMSLINLNKNVEFLGQYTENYVKYCNSYLGKGIHSDEEKRLYVRLISDAPKAQNLLMDLGFIDYKPGGTWSYIKDYQVLINTVQLLRNPISNEDFKMLYNILLMHVSRLNELFEKNKKETLNPIILLREGIQFFVTLPISLLFWTGIIKHNTQYKLSNNFFVKFISFLVILIGLISSIFTIVLGWEQFKEFLLNFI